MEELTRRLAGLTPDLELRGQLTEVRAQNAALERALEESRRRASDVEVWHQLLKERVLKKYRDQGPARSGAHSAAGPAEPPRSMRSHSTFGSLGDLVSISRLYEAQPGSAPRAAEPEASVGSRPPLPPARRPREDEGSSRQQDPPGNGEGEGES